MPHSLGELNKTDSVFTIYLGVIKTQILFYFQILLVDCINSFRFIQYSKIGLTLPKAIKISLSSDIFNGNELLSSGI
jgi:hypothetical protein